MYEIVLFSVILKKGEKARLKFSPHAKILISISLAIEVYPSKTLFLSYQRLASSKLSHRTFSIERKGGGHWSCNILRRYGRQKIKSLGECK